MLCHGYYHIFIVNQSGLRAFGSAGKLQIDMILVDFEKKSVIL